MSEGKMVNELVLAGDELDRGEYAMTLFKIIVEFAPKISLDVVDNIALGSIFQSLIIWQGSRGVYV